MGCVYKHIVWDWNGTLLNDVGAVYLIFLDLLNSCGIESMPIDEYRHKMHHPLKDFYAECGIDFNKLSYEDILKNFYKNYNEVEPECRLFEDVVPTLEYFKSLGVSQSILSALEMDYLKRSVAARGITSYMTEVSGVPEGSSDKLEVAREWMKRQPYQANEILWVGDTDHDAEVAKSLGVDCILISRGAIHADSLMRFNVPVLGNLKALTIYLSGMQSATRALNQCA